MNPHTYLVAKIKQGGRALWLQTNSEYSDRSMTLSIRCKERPQWRIEPAAAARETAWDEAIKTLTLQLAYEHGAVEVTLGSTD
jgi:hypothetical protein